MFGGPGEPGDGKTIKERSTRLLPWSTAPAQLLNACGSNHLADAEPAQVWNVQSQGNKAVQYFYEGVDATHERQAVGVSRACGAIQDFVEVAVQAQHLDALIKPDVLSKIRKEAGDLLPHVRTLNGANVPTPGSQVKDDRARRFKRSRTEARVPGIAAAHRARRLP